MRLWIAEKKAVGEALAEYLGVVRRTNDGIETRNGLVVVCQGHLLSQANPEEYGASRYPGRPEELPILPKTWKLAPSKGKEAIFSVVDRAIKRRDVTEVVHVGDMDREGQLLVDELLDYCGNRRPVLRLWCDGLDRGSIEKGVKNLTPNDDFVGYRDEALARSRADWEVGMSMSRLVTLAVGQGVYHAGRVQSAVLALLAEREDAIKNFKPETFYVPSITVTTPSGKVKLEYVTPPKQKNKDEGDDTGPVRMTKEQAEALVKGAKGQSVKLSVVQEDKRVAPPLPWSIDALQVHCGKAHGMAPDETLAAAQWLYENKHTTYPRTEVSYYRESQHGEARDVLPKLPLVAMGIDVTPNPKLKTKAFDDTKVGAHPAISPSAVPAAVARLTPTQKNVYDAVVRVYVAQFLPLMVQAMTRVSVLVDGSSFAASGKIIKELGWGLIWPAGQDKPLPPVSDGETGTITEVEILERKTSPPEPITVGNIINVMKQIARFVENKEARAVLRETDGIGTSATRTTIVKNLIDRGYIIPTGRGKDKIVSVTERGRRVLGLLPDGMKNPVTTAMWERDLQKVQARKMALKTFMTQVEDALREWVRVLSAGIPSGRKWIPERDQTPVKESTGKSKKKSGAASRPAPPGYKTKKKSASTGKPFKAPKTQATYKPDYLDEKCPECGRPLVVKNGKFGKFTGCSGYPDCRYIKKDLKPMEVSPFGSRKPKF